MALTAQQQLDKAKANLDKVKSDIGDNLSDNANRDKLRKARKGLKRVQRSSAVASTTQGKRDKQEESRLKNIQKAEDQVAKKKAAKEGTLNTEAAKQAEEATAEQAAK